MPEGDTVHIAAVRLQTLVGERVEAVSPHPRGLATGVAAAVDGRRLEAVDAVGKHLMLRFEGGITIRSHLRMSGRWRVDPRGTARSGRPWLVLRGAAWEAAQWNGPVLVLDDGAADRLGPDVLAATTTVDELVASVRGAGPRRATADVLLDQRVVAGIGTMWLAEMLWQARVSPWVPATQVPDAGLRAMLEWARARMAAAVGGARPLRSVYRRAGRPCRRCGEPVAVGRTGDANRAVYWCPACQSG
jgi:endonuclease-8